MADIVDRKTRSRMMSGIKGKNTKPELLIRKALFARGFRYRLHDKKLPGKPDLVLPKYKAVISIHGCFWHGHNCHLFKWPKSNQEFWENKLNSNIKNDKKNSTLLLDIGWRVMTIWECATKGKERIELEEIVSRIESWLVSDLVKGEIKGRGKADHDPKKII